MTDAPHPFKHISTAAAEALARVAEEEAGTAYPAPPVERVTVKPLRTDFAFIDVRLTGASLSGIEARRDAAGNIAFRYPTRRDQHGRDWPICTLQPGAAEEVRRVVRRLWAPDGGGAR